MDKQDDSEITDQTHEANLDQNDDQNQESSNNDAIEHLNPLQNRSVLDDPSEMAHFKQVVSSFFFYQVSQLISSMICH